MPLRNCAVSFSDVRGVRHTVEVQAESLFEAAILGVRTFRGDPWIEHFGPATVLDIEVREPAARHAITILQVERWLEGASTSPNEGVKKSEAEDPARLALTSKRLSHGLIGCKAVPSAAPVGLRYTAVRLVVCRGSVRPWMKAFLR